MNEDFEEKGPRKLLNLGHTIGHALESLSFDKANPVPHGTAIAWGLVIETAIAISLSNKKATTEAMYLSLKNLVSRLYPPIQLQQNDIPALMNYIRSDKKNNQELLLFSLAYAPGDCQYNVPVSSESITQALQNHVCDIN